MRKRGMFCKLPVLEAERGRSGKLVRAHLLLRKWTFPPALGLSVTRQLSPQSAAFTVPAWQLFRNNAPIGRPVPLNEPSQELVLLRPRICDSDRRELVLQRGCRLASTLS